MRNLRDYSKCVFTHLSFLKPQEGNFEKPMNKELKRREMEIVKVTML